MSYSILLKLVILLSFSACKMMESSSYNRVLSDEISDSKVEGYWISLYCQESKNDSYIKQYYSFQNSVFLTGTISFVDSKCETPGGPVIISKGEYTINNSEELNLSFRETYLATCREKDHKSISKFGYKTCKGPSCLSAAGSISNYKDYMGCKVDQKIKINSAEDGDINQGQSFFTTIFLRNGELHISQTSPTKDGVDKEHRPSGPFEPFQELR